MINKLSKQISYLLTLHKEQMLRSEWIPLYGNPPVINYSPHAWHIFPEMSRATEITNSRTAVMWQKHVIRNKSSFVLRSFQINAPPSGCCEMTACYALSYCLLRSSKSIFQLCRLSEHVRFAFITNQRWVLIPIPKTYFTKKVKNSKIAYKYI